MSLRKKIAYTPIAGNTFHLFTKQNLQLASIALATFITGTFGQSDSNAPTCAPSESKNNSMSKENSTIRTIIILYGIARFLSSIIACVVYDFKRDNEHKTLKCCCIEPYLLFKLVDYAINKPIQFTAEQIKRALECIRTSRRRVGIAENDPHVYIEPVQETTIDLGIPPGYEVNSPPGYEANSPPDYWLAHTNNPDEDPETGSITSQTPSLPGYTSSSDTNPPQIVTTQPGQQEDLTQAEEFPIRHIRRTRRINRVSPR